MYGLWLKWILIRLAPVVLSLAGWRPALAQGESLEATTGVGADLDLQGTGSGQYPQSLLDPAGPQAEEMLGVLSFDLIVVTVLWIALTLLTLFIIIRFKRQKGDNSLPSQADSHRTLEIGWTVALTAGLIVLLWHPVKAEFFFETPPQTKDALDVEVIGHQWWWEFRYPNQKIVTANELHIPAGKVIRFKITSADVIHSPGVPRLGGKNDAYPGRITKMWIQADEPGVYHGQCFELCGASHARMLWRVVAQTPADFDKWVMTRQKPDVKAKSDLAKEGEKVFGRVCLACHTIDGTPFTMGTAGPNLTAFGTRSVIGGGVLKNTEENLATWISAPESVKPGSLMPNNIQKGLITEDEVPALVEYLEGLK